MQPVRPLRGPYKKWLHEGHIVPRQTLSNRRQDRNTDNKDDVHLELEGNANYDMGDQETEDYNSDEDMCDGDNDLCDAEHSCEYIFHDAVEFQPHNANDEPIYPGASITKGQSLLAVMLYVLRHRLTGAGLEDLLSLLNLHVPHLAPPSKYLFQKFFGNPALSCVAHYYCPECLHYKGQEPADVACEHCGNPFNKEASVKFGNFFLVIGVKDLLLDTLENHGVTLLDKSTRRPDGYVHDIVDGKMYQKLVKEQNLGKEDLTLMWNCDGLPIFKSSNYSIWPLQFTVNELTPKQRKENVMIAALWFGLRKPRMDTFLKPFVEECCDLASTPIQWQDNFGNSHQSKVFCLVCSSDAVARPLLRNTKQFNGEYGCDWCLHPGEVVEKGRGYVRIYPYKEELQVPRTAEQFKKNAVEALQSDSPVKGVKGVSTLLLMPMFNIISGFVPDYMHSVLLGVTRQFVSLWLDPQNCMQTWYIGRQIRQLDSKLLQIKPPHEITRTPRSLASRKYWKASEWRSFLLFYALVILPGILPPLFLDHFVMLVYSLHILLQERISQQEIKSAHISLCTFVQKMDVLYGKENITFNVHQLVHISESVENWGPLWATASFNFENNNGTLKSLYKGTQFVPQQIVQIFLLWRDIPHRLSAAGYEPNSEFGNFLSKLTDRRLMKEKSQDGLLTLGKATSLYMTASVQVAIEKLLQQTIANKNAESFDRFIYNNAVYNTTQYTRAEKRCNSNVLLISGEFCEIHLLLLCKPNCVCDIDCECQLMPFVIVKPYKVLSDVPYVNRRLGLTSKKFLNKVERTGRTSAHFLSEIKIKCVQADVWLQPLPNTCELD